MPLVPAKCPNCGGFVQVDAAHDAAICQFCNTPFIVEKAINNYTTHVNVGYGATVVVQGTPELDQLLKAGFQFLSLGNFASALEKFKIIIDKYPSEQKGWIGMIRSTTHEFQSSLEYVNLAEFYDSDYYDPFIKYEQSEKPQLKNWMLNASRVSGDAAELRECQQKLDAYLQKEDQMVGRRNACLAELDAMIVKSMDHTRFLQGQIAPMRTQMNEKSMVLSKQKSEGEKSDNSLGVLMSLAVGAVIISVMIGWFLSWVIPGLGGKVFGICVGVFVVLLVISIGKSSLTNSKLKAMKNELDQLSAQISAAENYNIAVHQSYNEQLLGEFCSRWGVSKEVVLGRRAGRSYSKDTVQERMKYR